MTNADPLSFLLEGSIVFLLEVVVLALFKMQPALAFRDSMSVANDIEGIVLIEAAACSGVAYVLYFLDFIFSPKSLFSRFWKMN